MWFSIILCVFLSEVLKSWSKYWSLSVDFVLSEGRDFWKPSAQARVWPRASASKCLLSQQSTSPGGQGRLMVPPGSPLTTCWRPWSLPASSHPALPDFSSPFLRIRHFPLEQMKNIFFTLFLRLLYSFAIKARRGEYAGNRVVH